MTVATLNGVPLLAQGVSWRATTGVTPHQAEFSVALSEVAFLLSIPRNEATLVFHGQTWEGLSIIEPGYSSDPNVGKVRVVDRRYWWPFVHHYQWINRRRRIGTRRRGKWNEKLQQAAASAFEYASFSTYDGAGKAWDAVQLIRYVVEQVDGMWPDVEPGADFKKIPLENVDIDHEGHEAIARVLRSMPGAEITIDPTGRVRVFSWLSGAESWVVGDGHIEIHGAAGPEVVAAGHVELIDRANARPEYIDVLFTPEIEVRFDFVGDDPSEATDGGTISQMNRAGTPRHIRNVLPLPDFEITDGTKTFYQGTYFAFEDALRLWTSPPGILSGLTHSIIRRAFVPERGLWAGIGLAGTLDAKGPVANWSARISAIQGHYRQTFQLPRDWVDRTLSLRPYLVATIDITTGQRAPAMAFSDHAIKASEKGMYLDAAARAADKMAYAWNVTGYPGENVEIKTEGDDATQPAPATVQIIDEDQGVIRVAYQVDPYGRGQMVFPSKLENTPTRNWKKSAMKTTPVFFNAITKGGKVVALAAKHRLAVILTLVPATSLYRVKIKPEDVSAMLPKAVRDGITDAKGPPKQIRVGPGIETARIAWSQAASDHIERSFAMRNVGKAGWVPEDLTTLLRQYCVNDGSGESTKKGERGASLQQIALAQAAAYYATTHDRVEGSMTGEMNAELIPQGAIDQVSHQVDGDGAATSTYSLRPTIEPLDIAAYFDASTFRIVFRRVQ